MSGGRLYLKRSIHGLSGGTLLARRGPQPADAVIASPWGKPDLLLTLSPEDVVTRRARGGSPRPARAPQPKTKKKPPRVYATSRARAQASEHLDRPIEVAVEKALRDGGANRDPISGEVAIVALDTDSGGLVAVVTRAPSPTTGRKSWLVIGVKAAA